MVDLVDQVLRILCEQYEVLKIVELGWQHSDQGWLSGKVGAAGGVFTTIRPNAPLQNRHKTRPL